MSDDLELIDFGDAQDPWLRPRVHAYVVLIRHNGRTGYPTEKLLVIAWTAEDAITQVNASAHNVTTYDHTGPRTYRSYEALTVAPLDLGSLRIGEGWS